MASLIERWRRVGQCVATTCVLTAALSGAAAWAQAAAPAVEQASHAPRPKLQTTPLWTQGRTPYDIDATPHLVGTLSLYSVLVLAEGTVKPLMAGHLNCRLAEGGQACDAARLFGPDKSVVGQHSARWRKISDWGNIVALGGAVIATVADSALSHSAQPAVDAGTDILVMAESVGVATLVTHALKFAIRRPRPSMYTPGRYGLEAELSFPSGHTTAAAAGCAAYATTYALRHPHHAARYGVALAGVGVTALTAYGRVAGGMHFYTDVLAGAAVGGAIGYLLPKYYARGLRLDVTLPGPQAPGDAAPPLVGMRVSLPFG